jgi:dimethylargininase
MASCELTHLEREPIDMERLVGQHERYVELLTELGCRVTELSPEPSLPDAVFVEDTAVVLDELAVITRPGAASRRPELDTIARALAPHRELVRIEAPGILDGGDVLRLGRRLFVGSSTRSNAGGIEQLAVAVGRHGYRVEAVPVRSCLHLKSAACAIGEDAVLAQADWVDPALFGASDLLLTHPQESGAANVLCLGAGAIFPDAFPHTRERLEAFGLSVHSLDISELQKAEGAVTCCSLLLQAD